MKLKPVKLAPALIAGCVIAFVCLLRLLNLDFFERFERMAYDMRAREAIRFSAPEATNLGFVYIDDASIAFVKTNKSLGYRYGLYWPRYVYGRLVEELSAQGARAIAFDVIFGELRLDHPPVQMVDGRFIQSDEFFGLQLQRAGNVILADANDITPPDLFATNAFALGDITTDTNKDSDGVLRRAQAFRVYRKWHPLFRQVEADPDYGVDLTRAKIESKQILLPRANGEVISIPIDAERNFELADFVGEKLPAGLPPKAKAFTDERIWHMGIVVAAQELQLDLAKAEVDLQGGKIFLRGTNGSERILPVDENGYFYINWCLPLKDPRLLKEPIQNLLQQDRWRLDGTNGLPNNWAGRLVIVGSSATGNDLTDRGATPLDRDTLLASEHWNVANSVLTNRFIRRTPLAMDLLLISFLGILAAVLTWRLRVFAGSGLVVLVMAAYLVFAFVLYVKTRYWLPLFLPLAGAMFMNYVALMSWRVIFEQAEQRRVRSIFSTVVSPKIMHELLTAERLSLGGALREVTILFADVRGFTEFTDRSQEKAVAYVAENKLSGEAAKAYYDEQARETLATINLYLGLVADTIVRQDATLDKFIGDCVMAFWGAPTSNPSHARACVRAAIAAQRAIAGLNQQRAEENKKIETENQTRISAGHAPLPLFPILLLGSGINTGMVTVGLMGSETKTGVGQGNYTVFGREVNLASRLESLSGQGRIIISEATYERLLRDDAELAKTCKALPDATVKGIRSAVKVYEVLWQQAAPISSGTGSD